MCDRTLERVLEALAADLKDHGGLDLPECFWTRARRAYPDSALHALHALHSRSLFLHGEE